MKVNIIGFELDFAKKIDLPEVYQLLESRQGKKRSFHGDSYLYYTDVVDDYIIGIVLRLKKDKGRITTKEDNNEFIVDIDKLASGQSSTEVSLFCLNPKSLKGVFYSYFGGLSPSILRTIWRPAHDKIKKEKIKDLTKQLKSSNKYDKDKAKKEAQDTFYGMMSLTTLTTPATVENLLNVFSTIKEVSINSENAVNNAGKYSPNSSMIKKAAVHVKFNSTNAWFQEVKQYVRSIIPSQPKSNDIIRLIGNTIGGEEKTYLVGENLQEFGSFEFDNFIKKIPQKKWSDFGTCEAIEVLLNILKTKPIIFEHTVPEKNWRLNSANYPKTRGVKLCVNS